MCFGDSRAVLEPTVGLQGPGLVRLCIILKYAKLAQSFHVAYYTIFRFSRLGQCRLQDVS